MKRKRFVKLLMANGVDRNDANILATRYTGLNRLTVAGMTRMEIEFERAFSRLRRKLSCLPSYPYDTSLIDKSYFSNEKE